MQPPRHISVLAKEVIEALNITPDATVVDATLGSGGHARQVLEKLGTKGTFIGLDADQRAIEEVSQTLGEQKSKLHLIHANFRNIDEVLRSLELDTIDALYADLGWRIEQYEGGEKGFSFRKEEPLLMTYGDPKDTAQYPFTAHDIVNGWEESAIADVLYGYGEERYSRRIARAIVERRHERPIVSAQELGNIIQSAVPVFYRRRRIHPATKSFQALRIAVNDELGAIEACIDKTIPFLKQGGRIAIITFHSIEDRLVKKMFRRYSDAGSAKMITKKPLVPEKEEVAKNPRSRSAKLRILEKT